MSQNGGTLLPGLLPGSCLATFLHICLGRHPAEWPVPSYTNQSRKCPMNATLKEAILQVWVQLRSLGYIKPTAEAE